MAALALAAALPLFGGNYALTVGSEIAIFVIFAASLHFLMSVGGLASFGHAAYFGLGAYGVALLAKLAGPADDRLRCCSARCSGCSARRCSASSRFSCPASILRC